MRLAVVCLFAVTVVQAAATRNVTVVVKFEKPHSDVSVAAFRHELHDLLQPAGIAVDVLLKSEMPLYPQFSELAVFDMKGSCSMDESPAALHTSSEERGPLGSTFMSDGEILHFGEVQCDRLRRCLRSVTRGGLLEDQQVEYGVALGIIVAHEICHMMAGAAQHSRNGLTKESLTARELLDPKISIPASVRAALSIGLLERTAPVPSK